MPFDMFAVEEGVKKAKYAASKPLKLSYSSFKNAQQCKAKYAMANVLYWTPKTIDTRNFFLGSVGHSCMERWIKEGSLQRGFMPDIALEEFDLYLKSNTVVPLNKHDMGDLRIKAVMNAQALEDTFFTYGLHEKRLVSEKKWQVSLPGYDNVLLIGTMDLMSPEDNVIYDLKMTKNANFMDEDQLNIYAMMGVLSGLKTTKAGFIVPLRKEKVVTVEFEAADFTAMLRRLQDEVSSIKDNLKTGKWDFHYVKNDCFRCQVNQSCSRYKSETGLLDRPTSDHGGGRVIQF
jgi:hypothetical protein